MISLISVTTLHADHQELDDRLGQVREAPTCEEARRLLRAAMGAAREHFRDEERRLFPAVERALGVGALTALGEAFMRAPEARAIGAGSLARSGSWLAKVAPLRQ